MIEVLAKNSEKNVNTDMLKIRRLDLRLKITDKVTYFDVTRIDKVSRLMEKTVGKDAGDVITSIIDETDKTVKTEHYARCVRGVKLVVCKHTTGGLDA